MRYTAANRGIGHGPARTCLCAEAKVDNNKSGTNMKSFFSQPVMQAALSRVVSKVANHLPSGNSSTTAPIERTEPELPAVVPTPVQPAPDRGPWLVNEWSNDRVVLQSDDFAHDVALIVDGDFAGYEDKLDYAKRLANWLNERLQQDAALGLVIARPGYDNRFEVDVDEYVDVAAVDAQLAALCEEAAPAAPVQTPVAAVVDAVLPVATEAEQDPDENVLPAVTRSRRAEPVAEPLVVPEEPAVAPDVAPAIATPKPASSVVAFAKPATPERPRATRYGCHCELPPGEEPGPCVIDLNQRQYCGHAMKGIRRDECQFWQPIVMKL